MNKKELIKSLLPYIGEYILEEIINKKEKEFLDLIKNKENLPKGILSSEKLSIHRQISIKGNGFSFDGMSKIDLGILFSINKKEYLFPIEVKLGKTRLLTSDINKKLLGCKFSSHNSKILTGNMMSILDRKMEDDKFNNTLDKLYINEKEMKGAEITREWSIIAFEEIISKLDEKTLDFRNKVSFIPVESIINLLGEEKFNKMIKNMFECENFYKIWFAKDK